MKNKLIPITILAAALLMGKSNDYKTLDYKYKVKKYVITDILLLVILNLTLHCLGQSLDSRIKIIFQG